MTWIRRLALPTLVVLLCLVAAPAQATLLVKSDSSGLLVQDKNGIGDRVVVTSGTLGGNPVYVVTNNNSFDVFKFDRQANCSAGATGDKSVCKKFNGKLNLAMAGGDDNVQVGGSGASSSSVNLGDGNDVFVGTSGPDNVVVGLGDNEVVTAGGDDDITLRTGKDTVKSGSGDDEIDKEPFFDVEADRVESGSGDDIVSMQSTERSVVLAGSGDDIVHLVSIGDDFVDAGTGADNVSTAAGDDEIIVKEPAEPGVRDEVTCGQDQDFVTADLKDKVSVIADPGGGTCEEVERSPVGETPHVSILGKSLHVSKRGRVKVRLRCPRGVHKLGCKGALQVRVARTRKGGVQASRSRKVRYKIRAGRRKTVALRLTGKDVKRIRAGGKRARAIVVSVEKGRKGRKTTVRNPRLKLRGG